ncbi:VOC family protein [Arthrobacter pigmenti]
MMTGIDSSDAVKTPPHWGINLRVADTEATAQKTRDLGGQVLMPPTKTPEFVNAVLMDSQGAVFSVSQVLE